MHSPSCTVVFSTVKSENAADAYICTLSKKKDLVIVLGKKLVYLKHLFNDSV